VTATRREPITPRGGGQVQLVLERHHDLEEIEAVGSQIFHDARRLGEPRRYLAQDLVRGGHEGLEQFVSGWHRPGV